MSPDQSAQPPDPAAPRGASSEPSRRSVLRGAAGVGAAATAFAAVGGQALAATPTRNPDLRKSDLRKSEIGKSHVGESEAAESEAGESEAGESEAGESEIGESPAGHVVAHLRDGRTGAIDVYRGTSHSRIHDVDLAARLVRASSPGAADASVSGVS